MRGWKPGAAARIFAASNSARARERREALTGIFFVLPVVLGFIVFVAGPMLSTFVLGFFYYDLLSPPKFAGLDHFAWMLEDRRLRTVLGNTAFFTFFAVLGNTAIAVVLAVALNRGVPDLLKISFRAAYFFPFLVGLIFVAIIWQFLFQKDLGVINHYLNRLGVPSVGWLSDPGMALVSVVILDVWKNIGFGMLVVLAGLQGISGDYYDAARVEGAGPVQKFFRVTLPLLSPTILFLLVIHTIGALKVFDVIVVLTGGGPGDASRSIVMYIYETAFKSLEMGYASAVSLLLLGVIVALTLAQFLLSRRWVFYEQ